MKKFALYLAALAAVAIAALALNDFAWVRLLTASTSNFAYKVRKIYNPAPEPSIAIFGSSRAEVHIAAHMLDKDAFNFGMSAMHIGEITELIEIYLSKTPDSKIPIIINLDPWICPNSTTWENAGDYSLVDGELPGIRSFGKLRDALSKWSRNRTTAKCQVTNGTMLQRINRTAEEWKNIHDRLTKEVETKSRPANRNEIVEFYKNRIERLARSTQRPFYWYVAPLTRYCRDLNNMKYGYDHDINEFCAWLETLPNQKVLNLYNLDYDDSMFFDPTHLNFTGATNFTARIKAWLKSEGALPTAPPEQEPR